MAFMALQSAATGLSALNTQLDVIANNLANVNTQGFKSSRVNFEDLLYQERKMPGVENANGDIRPIGLYVGLGVQVSGTQLDFEQGSLQQTDRQLDIAIQGHGLLQVRVEDEKAPNGIAYTRFGAMTRDRDGNLVMANDTGYRLVPEINIPEEATAVNITNDGRVQYRVPGNEQLVEAGQIELAGFINEQGLQQLGMNLYAETPASGPPILGYPTEEGLGSIQEGFLETSNVDATRELVDMIRTQRAFEMNSQVIRAADDTLRAVAQLRR